MKHRKSETGAAQHDSCCSTPHSNPPPSSNTLRLPRHWKPISSFLLLILGLSMDHLIHPGWFADSVRTLWYLLAYLPVGVPVLADAARLLKKGEMFNEFSLMGIATIGAFAIGEYPEGVAVMLFYSVGEAFQHNAVHRARENIRALLDVRSEQAWLKENGTYRAVHPDSVQPGDVIRVRPGERIPLDGFLGTERAAFDTSALTGESRPRHFESGEQVLAGMICLNRVVEITVSAPYEKSAISRIIKMVQEAASRKARTELFIRSFAKVYTPIVVLLAVLIVALPALFTSPYNFEQWFYRGLVFLVISCPCALVISIPLGYFGGIGAASRNGILVKGGNYLDALRSVDTVVLDKTGTLTQGVFAVRQVQLTEGREDEILPLVHATESGSTHPIAKAITHYLDERYDIPLPVEEQREIPGFGISATVSGRKVLLGSMKLFEGENIPTNGQPPDAEATTVYVAVDGIHVGTISVSDEIREDSERAVQELRDLGIREIVMLSGDRREVAEAVGAHLKLDRVYGELLPADKTKLIEQMKSKRHGTIAFAGDGINDAPALALSDVGIAMGAMGSDAAIETADVVIQTDQPSKIATAIRIARATRTIVWQNITLAMGIKLIFLGLGAFGLASLWEAVFADVGVALLAILNAIRIQHMDFGAS